MENKTALQTELVGLAEAYALDYYGCDLSRLDPDLFQAYLDRVTEADLDWLAFDMADAAWFDN